MEKEIEIAILEELKEINKKLDTLVPSPKENTIDLDVIHQSVEKAIHDSISKVG